MTPEERAKSVLHFLDAYLTAREEWIASNDSYDEWRAREQARNFLGTALVALVTEAKPETKPVGNGPPCHPEAHWMAGAPIGPNQYRAICSVCGTPAQPKFKVETPK